MKETQNPKEKGQETWASASQNRASKWPIRKEKVCNIVHRWWNTRQNHYHVPLDNLRVAVKGDSTNIYESLDH